MVEIQRFIRRQRWRDINKQVDIDILIKRFSKKERQILRLKKWQRTRRWRQKDSQRGRGTDINKELVRKIERFIERQRQGDLCKDKDRYIYKEIEI